MCDSDSALLLTGIILYPFSLDFFRACEKNSILKYWRASKHLVFGQD